MHDRLESEDEALLRVLQGAIPPGTRLVEPVSTISADAVRQAIRKMRPWVAIPCPHAVHPEEWERGGEAFCVQCGALLNLGSR